MSSPLFFLPPCDPTHLPSLILTAALRAHYHTHGSLRIASKQQEGLMAIKGCINKNSKIQPHIKPQLDVKFQADRCISL